MTMYASSAGKSGGEFFTPQEVSELLARITLGNKKTVNKVYDPACGSGSLLLKFAKILGQENVKNGFYGQEINITTYNLCRINMFLHNINYEKFDIALGDTLTRLPKPNLQIFCKTRFIMGLCITTRAIFRIFTKSSFPRSCLINVPKCGLVSSNEPPSIPKSPIFFGGWFVVNIVVVCFHLIPRRGNMFI